MEGMSSNVITVAKIIPKPRLMAMGIRNLACTLFSNIMGIRPKDVVSDVSRMGRKRRNPALFTAS